jgi:FHS family L-fucose permease-like MFS transporter
MQKQQFSSNPVLFSGVSVLFFIWGVVTILNDLLVPIFKQEFSLGYAGALLVQFAFFITYFIMSLPMSSMVNKLRYKNSILFGLAIIIVGCLLFIFAHYINKYYLFLIGLFVLATGVVMLQVSANTLVAGLGSEKTSSARLTLAQGINSLGYVITPLIVGAIITAATLSYVYIFIAVLLVVVMVAIKMMDFSAAEKINADDVGGGSFTNVLANKYFIWALLAIFLYVGAEVSAGSVVVNFLGLPEIAALSIKDASRYLAVFWGGAMIGRFLGSYILSRFQQTKVLLTYALINTVLVLVTAFAAGHIAMWSILALGLFNSIMFPSIFAMGVELFQTAKQRNNAAGWLIMSIVGGACVPVILGYVADVIGLQHAIAILSICYIIIAIFAILMQRQFGAKSL